MIKLHVTTDISLIKLFNNIQGNHHGPTLMLYQKCLMHFGVVVLVDHMKTKRSYSRLLLSLSLCASLSLLKLYANSHS